MFLKFARRIRQWWHGTNENYSKNKKQHLFREPGQIENDEEPMNYSPGFWERTAKPFVKTVMYVAMAASAVTLSVVAIRSGCAYSERQSAEALQIEADMPCRSTFTLVRSTTDQVTCTHKDHVLTKERYQGELMIQCLCPNNDVEEPSSDIEEPKPEGLDL